jgi:D-glycero-D-manno-heptose 1,7-bisphosphate phosphatase
MHPALFLDRDGVIIENRANYVRSWSDVSFYPKSLETLVQVSRFPVKIVIVTNQSAVGRGLISMDVARQINTRLEEMITKAGGRVDGIYMCPHHPEDGCDCRKPRPGMLLQAAGELSLDLKRSALVGDALTDLLAAEAAGVPVRFLVRTGRGQRQEKLARVVDLHPFQIYDNLSIALLGKLPEAARKVGPGSTPLLFL